MMTVRSTDGLIETDRQTETDFSLGKVTPIQIQRQWRLKEEATPFCQTVTGALRSRRREGRIRGRRAGGTIPNKLSNNTHSVRDQRARASEQDA
jgi:hypothetical protein